MSSPQTYNLPTFLVNISSLSSRLKEASGFGEGAFTTGDTGGGVVSLGGGVVSVGGGVGSFSGGLISFCDCLSTGDTTLAGDGDLKPFAVTEVSRGESGVIERGDLLLLSVNEFLRASVPDLPTTVL